VYVAVILVTAMATLFGAPATLATASPTRAPGEQLCSIDEWQNPVNFDRCAAGLKNDIVSRASCLDAPNPDAPDSGMAGWFAEPLPTSERWGHLGLYSRYGYAGYDFNTYDLKCAAAVTNPSAEFETTIANGEFTLATSIIGASNAVRERAWNPSYMWGWADPLVDKTTRAIYDKVFTPFGAVTLAIVGLYLLWRSRQSDLSNAMTTAGWAVFVMILISALAAWPTWSAHLADKTLTSSLGVIHDAVGPPEETDHSALCERNPRACIDHRVPALRASDTAVRGLLYENWLRGTLGSADSETAQKYGPALYDARSFTWDEIEEIRSDEANTRKENEQHIAAGDPIRRMSTVRNKKIDEKSVRWKEIAEQIKAEDPEAYQHLQGTKGMDRIGAGFLAILSALFFALFDLTASILVILGFLIFRWAVIVAPMLGTIGLLRPANAGLRRLGNAVIAAIFNIIIFGTGSAVYLFAVSQILTASLAPWLQVLLIWLSGIVGWLLLRPYRRITQLGGKDSTRAITSAGNWHRLFLRDVRTAAAIKLVEAGGTKEPGPQRGGGELQSSQRPEARSEDTVSAGTGPGVPTERPETGADPRAGAQQKARRRESTWDEPDLPAENAPSYSIYRPDSDHSTRSTAGREGVRRPESASLPG